MAGALRDRAPLLRLAQQASNLSGQRVDVLGRYEHAAAVPQRVRNTGDGGCHNGRAQGHRFAHDIGEAIA
jgi:hypothetical protein